MRGGPLYEAAFDRLAGGFMFGGERFRVMTMEHALHEAGRLGTVGSIMRTDGYERRDEHRLD
eukprot:2379722-Prymnesium_polylepis.1